MALTATDPAIADVVARALAEDVGDGDVTGLATVPEEARATALISQKEPGVIFGLAVAEEVFRQCDPSIAVERLAPEGEWRDSGAVMRASGDARRLLAAERTALNFLGRLSGVATETARHVRAVEGTGVRILDTRKTTPGLRTLEKAAVLAGGGHNHRIGLFDQILIKENHAAMAGGVGNAVRLARAAYPDLPLEAECRDAGEVREALAAGARRLLLDNMTPEQLAAIAAEVGGSAELEASGGVSLETLPAIARTGVHAVSIGALTHSARTLDLSLLLDAVA
ncbi:MAG: Quinolinate phosphoribosyltransferase [decarboxylating] [uncultured Solirubrobacteraceae bacterium]|uniref:Nicotinate-nucleotide pyrophosphorylase [carboxylating] n=1 Tax=uncultured Solirubrobacteraceae bacterium TaxID=1162706 RepID=A0A6J4SBK0_9ACTN|nr:MAG: Quinolinate phosphoribosyltransferase [decarboxylating] [uncultured Solirubrobacteraceae bacterium]